MAIGTSAITTEEGLDKTQLSTSEAGTTYSIAIDSTGVDNHIKIYGMNYTPRGGVQVFDLEEGIYSLHGALVGKFALFEVNTLSYLS